VARLNTGEQGTSEKCSRKNCSEGQAPNDRWTPGPRAGHAHTGFGLIESDVTMDFSSFRSTPVHHAECLLP